MIARFWEWLRRLVAGARERIVDQWEMASEEDSGDRAEREWRERGGRRNGDS
jgi:hypothetical protein